MDHINQVTITLAGNHRNTPAECKAAAVKICEIGTRTGSSRADMREALAALGLINVPNHSAPVRVNDYGQRRTPR